MNQLKALLTGQSRAVVLLIAAGFVNAACILLLNRGYAELFNAAIAREPSGIAKTALMLAAVAVVNGAINVLEHMLYGRIAENTGHRFRTEAAGHQLRAECSALHGRHTGDSLSRVTLELKQVSDWMRGQFCPMIIEAAVLLSVLAAMLLVNWKLTVAAFAIVPAVTFYAVKASRPIRRAVGEQQAALAQSNALVKSVMDAFPIVKIFGMKAIMSAKYGRALDEAVRMAVKANSVERLLMSINGLSALIPMGILLGFGGAMTLGGGISAGVLLAYLNLSGFIVSPLMNLPNRISAARAFYANLGRVRELTRDPLESQRPMNRRLPDRMDSTAILLKDVSFGYDAGRPVLKHVNLTVPQGSRTALVGPSGCGKSTVVKLLAALYMPQEGFVAIQGRDTRKWDLRALRGNLAVVMQDPFLFPGSMMENITCGNDMPREKVLDACRAAGLLQLIESLPGGLDTDVGEHGAKLSGGQKQRVAIARAIARDAPILLLDEATSALDSRTERDIQEALDTFMRGRTTLIITHRLSGIKDADRIYCMDNGGIEEWGTHGELMALDGYYAGLYRVQCGAAEAAQRGDCP